ncbi:hypothetical protein [Methylobacterium sp. Leaf118]|uniref:hypothetical protein n=1 Tax=Methylobacterium sp. Leaf118 TaxID=2876562 RepID=UPI001E61C52C|nr:hypothetical protein [Methylobacterium sp. Leaf118]
MAETPTHATLFVSISTDAYEDCARIAECWRCEALSSTPQVIRERTERQNKVAVEIAAAIRAKGESASIAISKNIEAIARSIAAEKVGSADPTGSRLPEDIWRQCLPEARLRQALGDGKLREAAAAVLRACIADMEFGLAHDLHDDEPVRESLFGDWRSALTVGDLRRLETALRGTPRWPPSKDEEAAELFQSERISEALATFDYVLGDLEPDDPDREERTFDAMKAAIQRADHIARPGRIGEV